jgi:RHS repeat-associated protein
MDVLPSAFAGLPSEVQSVAASLVRAPQSTPISALATAFTTNFQSRLAAGQIVGLGSVVNSAGTLAGQFDVSEHGVASYRLPISIPVGVNGLAPEVGLSYQSAGGDGAYGMGWSMDLPPLIRKCEPWGATEIPDNPSGRAFWDRTLAEAKTRICFGESPLVRVSGNLEYDRRRLEPGHYRTVPDQFLDIERPADVDEWLVREADGRVHRYVRQNEWWARRSTTDSSGNRMMYRYSCADDESIVDPIDGVGLDGRNSLPCRIDYVQKDDSGCDDPESGGACFSRHVRFVYGSHPKARTVYGAGGPVNMDRLLKRIVVTGDGHEGEGYSYELTHSSSEATGRPTLRSIRLCTESGTCIPETTFQYADYEPGDERWVWGHSRKISEGTMIVDSRQCLGNNYPVLRGRIVPESVISLDLNADGRDDIAWLSRVVPNPWKVPGFVQYALSTGGGQFSEAKSFAGDVQCRQIFPWAGTRGSNERVACIAEDGLYAFDLTNESDPNRRLLSSAIHDTGIATTGDFNGDGKNDLLACIPAHVSQIETESTKYWQRWFERQNELEDEDARPEDYVLGRWAVVYGARDGETALQVITKRPCDLKAVLRGVVPGRMPESEVNSWDSWLRGGLYGAIGDVALVQHRDPAEGPHRLASPEYTNGIDSYSICDVEGTGFCQYFEMSDDYWDLDAEDRDVHDSLLSRLGTLGTADINGDGRQDLIGYTDVVGTPDAEVGLSLFPDRPVWYLSATFDHTEKASGFRGFPRTRTFGRQGRYFDWNEDGIPDGIGLKNEPNPTRDWIVSIAKKHTSGGIDYDEGEVFALYGGRAFLQEERNYELLFGYPVHGGLNDAGKPICAEPIAEPGNELGVDGVAAFVEGDFDGDGRRDLADIYTAGDSKVHFRPRLRAPLRSANPESRPVPDALVSVTDGLGSTIQLDYLPMTDSRVMLNPPRIGVGYAANQGDCGTSCDEERVVNDGRSLVWKVTSPTHSALTNAPSVTTYRYDKFLHDVRTNSPLGFDRVQKIVELQDTQVIEMREYQRAPDGPLSSIAISNLARRSSGLVPKIMTRFTIDFSARRSTRVYAETKEEKYQARRTVDAGLFYAPYFVPMVHSTTKFGEFVMDGPLDFFKLRTAWNAIPDSSKAVTVEAANESSFDEFGNRLSWTVIQPDGSSTLTTSAFVREAGALEAWRVRLPRFTTVETRKSLPSTPASGSYDEVLSTTRSWTYCDVGPCAAADYARGLPRWEVLAPADPVHEVQTRYEYDTWGNRTEIMTRGRSGQPGELYTPAQIETNEYDAEHLFPTFSANSLGHYWRRESDWRFGQLIYELDANGREKGWGYDILRRQIYELDKGGFDSLSSPGFETTIEYAAGGTTAGVKTPIVRTERKSDGSWRKDYIDALGRKVAESYPAFEGHTRSRYWKYDALGNAEYESLPFNGSPTSTGNGAKYIVREMGFNGRLWREQFPNGLVHDFDYGRNDSGAWSLSFQGYVLKDRKQYDHSDLLLATSDGVYNQRCYAHNANGALRATWSLKSGVGSGDIASNCRQHALAFGGVTEINNDAYGFVTDVDDPEAGVTVFTRDAFGRTTLEVDAKDNEQSFEYDALGRIVKKITPEGEHVYQWDTYMLGSLARVSGPWGTRQTVHDNLGRPRSEVYQYAPDFEAAWTIYNYDQISTGKLASITLPAAGDIASAPRPKLNYKYTPNGHLAGVLNFDKSRAYWHRLQTDVFGQTSYESYGAYTNSPWWGEVTTTRETDGFTGRVSRLTSYGFNEWGNYDLIQDFSIQRQLNGQAWRRSDGIVQQQEIYNYDSANRLRVAQIGNWWGTTEVNYDYDPIGNLTRKSDTGTLVYDNPNSPRRLIRAGSTTYDYDANGNVTSRGAANYTWDKEDNLRSIHSPSADLDFTYDDSGSLIRRESTDGSVWHYYGADYSREQIHDPWVGAVTRHHYRVRVDGDVVAELTYAPKRPGDPQWPDAVEYILPDDRQSTNLVVGAGRGVEQRMSWDVYGQKRDPWDWSYLSASLPRLTNSTVGFTGHRQIEDDGLIWMKARHFDPKIGRFVKPDSIIGKPEGTQGWGRYVYVENDPVNATDPSGHVGMSGASAAVAASLAQNGGFTNGAPYLPESLAFAVGDQADRMGPSEQLLRSWARLHALSQIGEEDVEPEADSRNTYEPGVKALLDQKGRGSQLLTQEEWNKVLKHREEHKWDIVKHGVAFFGPEIATTVATLGLGTALKIVGIGLTMSKGAARARQLKRLEKLKAANESGQKVKAAKGRGNAQERLRELANDDKLGSADRGWIRQEINAIDAGKRTSIRNPPGKDLAHSRGREAAKGYDHVESPSNLQDRDLHRLQHKFDDFGRKNKERP